MSLDALRVEINASAHRLFKAIGITDQSLDKQRSRRTEILDRHDPATQARRNFNAWRQTHEGKNFKQELYVQQDGCCCAPDCTEKGKGCAIENLQFDHIQPLSRFPKLALEKTNLQLLCSACNLSKGDRI